MAICASRGCIANSGTIMNAGARCGAENCASRANAAPNRRNPGVWPTDWGTIGSASGSTVVGCVYQNRPDDPGIQFTSSVAMISRSMSQSPNQTISPRPHASGVSCGAAQMITDREYVTKAGHLYSD